MIKLNAVAAIEQFEKFCARGTSNSVTIQRDVARNSFYVILRCDYSGKRKAGAIVKKDVFV